MTDINIQQFKEEKQVLNLTIQDDDNNPLDLTNPDVKNVYLDVATDLTEYGEHQFQKTGTNLAADGTVKIVIQPSDTENLRPGNYLYELWVEYNSSTDYTAEIGKFFVKPVVKKQ
jgi:hypothetical protein